MNRSNTQHCRFGQLSLIVAIILASHAAVSALASGHDAGCGGGGCADVMSSKWATVLGMPVALPGVVLYLVTLALGATRGVSALRFCKGLILMAAAYFMIIQTFWIGSFCTTCIATHGFAVLGVILISRGANTSTSASELSGIRHALPMLVAAVCLGGLAAIQFAETGGSRASQVRMIAEEGREFPDSFFFKPFLAATGVIGVALDGGELPVSGAEVPEILFGRKTTLQPLQVVMLTDWTCAHCMELHAMLHRIYNSPESDSLPAISLRLLPVSFDEKAEAAHRAMLNVHFGTGNPEAFPTLAREITSGKLSPDPVSIRAGLSEIDSPTASRWETLPAILETSVSRAFELAESQMSRNSAHLEVSTLPQLTVFDAVLSGLPSESELVEFLQSAATRQQALLQSPLAPSAPAVRTTCGCAKSSGHDHEHSCAIATAAPSDGPQIKFDQVSVKTRPIAIGESTDAIFHFTNTGNATLEVNTIHTGCGCIIARDWSRKVAPGEKGSITFTYDSKSKQDAGPGEHIRHVWVATNSVVRTDPSYGHQLEITVPVTSAPMPPRALSMTAAAP